MQFADSDLDAILDATGETVTILLGGVQVKSIMAKFRTDAQTQTPFEMLATEVTPAILVKSSDVADLDNGSTFLIRSTEYVRKNKPQNRNDGLTHIFLAVKK